MNYTKTEISATNSSSGYVVSERRTVELRLNLMHVRVNFGVCLRPCLCISLVCVCACVCLCVL